MDLVPMGATNLLMVISTSCAIFLSIGQTVFQERLEANLSGVLSPDLVDRIVEGGALSIRQLVDSVNLPPVLKAYSDSVAQVFWIPAIAPVVSFILVAFCKWTALKKEGDTQKDVESIEEQDSAKDSIEV